MIISVAENRILHESKAELTGLYQKLQQITKKFDRTAENLFNKKNKTEIRNKRQLAFGGGFGMGFGAYDYNDYYGEYVSDYAYDYYDWICSDTACQLCDILTSECCDPAIDVNCFLPDSCLNNPCLSGGTCITTRTLDNQPDFICVCLPGLTGKYCQLVNDYFVGAEIAFAPAVAAVGGMAPGVAVGGVDPAAAAVDPATGVATADAAAPADASAPGAATAVDNSPTNSVAAGTFVDPNQQGQQSFVPQGQPQMSGSQYGQSYGQQPQPDVQQLQQQLAAYQQLFAQLQQQQQMQQQPQQQQQMMQPQYSGQAATQNLAMTSNNQANNA